MECQSLLQNLMSVLRVGEAINKAFHLMSHNCVEFFNLNLLTDVVHKEVTKDLISTVVFRVKLNA